MNKMQSVVEYRKAGHSIKDTAEHFGIKASSVKDYCSKAGVRAGYADGRGPIRTIEEREEHFAELISQKWPGWEYAGGYTGVAGRVAIRHKCCGTIVNKSAVTMRHYSEGLICPTCSKAYVRNTLRIETFMSHWEAEERARQREQRRKQREHPCAVCGSITTRNKYCSSDCARKAGNAQHELKKRKFFKEKVIDKDITLQRLFKRDRGICWICGQMCDYGDYERKDGYFVAGNRYPSIDHIIPRCEGGEHSWANIKLAHRICNTDSFKWMRKDSTKRHIAV